MPGDELSLKPTIVLRILIDATGKVREASVYRPRADLAELEKIALQAVQDYQFDPARRGGRPAPVWTNWPVEFR